MDKLKMQTPDLTEENIKKIAELFPNVITETISEDGKVKKAIDFDLLQQELSNRIVEGGEERYRLDWPGKRAAILKANTPITDKTLRPVPEESVDFEKTENLYIEGDNFQILKLLQESYLGHDAKGTVKMIYIDPPYNTGKDFVYRDNFTKDKEEYDEEIGAVDEKGNKLFKNTETNGRFHSDWLTMMYERLTVARDILREDGVIFISIDDNEVANLRKICDEIFGEANFIASIIWHKKDNASFLSKDIVNLKEYILLYKKSDSFEGTMDRKIDTEKHRELITKPSKISDRVFKKEHCLIENGRFSGVINGGKYGAAMFGIEILNNEVVVNNGIPESDILIRGRFCWSQENIDSELSKGGKIEIRSIKGMKPIFFKNFGEDIPFRSMIDILSKKIDDRITTNNDAATEIKELFDLPIFEYTKPSSLIKFLIDNVTKTSNNAIVLDFFSGSATTAHAVMQLNVEDGGNRKFVMVQIPEQTPEDSEARKAGYENICEIGKERIRRVAKKIQEDNKDKDLSGIDFGFRVYKLDSTNMKDVYYSPAKLGQGNLEDLKDNIKDDRTPEDLLTQVMLDLGIMLSAKIESRDILGNKVYFVEDNALVACFDKKINFNIVNEIAKIQPLRVVFRDAGFIDDKDRINVEERFKRLSPETVIKVL